MKEKPVEVHVVGGTVDQFLNEYRDLLAASPDSEFIKLQLANALLLNRQFAEAAMQASEVAPEDKPVHSLTTEIGYVEALTAVGSAWKRARSIIEEEARQIPGEDSFRITMESYDMALRMFDEEILQSHHS